MTNLPVGVMQQQFVFKSDRQGTAKNGRPWRAVELHDPVSLENMSFFLRDGSTVSSQGIEFKDQVIATFRMEIMFGKLSPVLESLHSI